MSNGYPSPSTKLAQGVLEAGRIGRHGLTGRFHTLTGRHERALADYAYLIRHIEAARESMWPYRRIDRLVWRGGSHLIPEPPTLPETLKGFVLFVGYSRSGHSLVGALLDAHPQIAISHELHALKHLKAGHPFTEVAAAIQYNTYFFHYFGRSYTGYDYAVPGQYQGHWGRLELLGDKKGNGTTRLLRRDPGLLETLIRHLPVPVYLIHVIRNPFDNIATKARRKQDRLEKASSKYFANTATIAELRARYPEQVIDLYLDDLIADPRATLSGLLNILGVTSVSEPYLAACAARVFEQPSRTRDRVAWEPALVRAIRAQLGQYPFLNRFLE